MFLVVFEDSGIVKYLANERDFVRENKRQKTASCGVCGLSSKPLVLSDSQVNPYMV